VWGVSVFCGVCGVCLCVLTCDVYVLVYVLVFVSVGDCAAQLIARGRSFSPCLMNPITTITPHQ
jgi:uncharacterized membrane protein YbaN (DUF454 family)